MVSRGGTLSSSRISQFRIRLTRFAPLKTTKKTKNIQLCACAYHNFSLHSSVSFFTYVVYDTLRESDPSTRNRINTGHRVRSIRGTIGPYRSLRSVAHVVYAYILMYIDITTLVCRWRPCGPIVPRKIERRTHPLSPVAPLWPLSGT